LLIGLAARYINFGISLAQREFGKVLATDSELRNKLAKRTNHEFRTLKKVAPWYLNF
jgi:hypothetical protein